MLHSKHITIPPNTSEGSPTEKRFIVNHGIIQMAWIHFPLGCAGLVKMRVFFEGHPFLPVDRDAFIKGENHTFAIPVMFEIKHAPTQILIQAWNEDDTYPHTIDVMLLINPRHLVMPVGASEGLIDALKSIFVRRN